MDRTEDKDRRAWVPRPYLGATGLPTFIKATP